MTFIFDTDTVRATDAGFSYISDTDGCTAAETATAITQPVHDADQCAAAETSWSSWPHDSDRAVVTETAAFFTGTMFVSDSDACTAAEAEQHNRVISDTEICTAFDTEHEQVEVYTYQPEFRWTGGGFELVWQVQESTGLAVISVWRGPIPDAGVYRLYEQLASAAEVWHVCDTDNVRVREEERAPALSVWVTARRALDVALGVAIMGVGKR